MAIDNVSIGASEISSVFDQQRAEEKKQLDNKAFDEALARAEVAVVSPQLQAGSAVTQVAQGAQGRIHETLLAVEKADISMRLLVNVRNKLLDAYREVMQMGG